MVKNNIIESLIVERNLSQTKVAKTIGMSREGFGRMLKSKTMKVSTLESIAEVLNVPTTHFFEEHSPKKNEFSEQSGIYKSEIPISHTELLNQLKVKDGQIAFLQKLLEEKNR